VIDRIEQARDLVRQRRLPRTLRRVGEEDDGLSYYDGFGTDELDTEVTSDVLARSLHYMIRLKLTSVSDEFELPLGASKHKGLPHLPPDLEWPGTHYFFAQFNLAELHPLDLYDAFPAGGMLYIFFDPAGEVSVIHYDGPLDSLRVVPYPSSAKDFTGAKYYLDNFRKRPSLIRYRPRCAFYLGSDAYDLSRTTKLIPKDLREEVASILGGRVASWDTDCRIFGRPLYWQGEDERYGRRRREEPRRLLFQDEFGEGHIHVWIDDADARTRDYSRCWMDYSGT
jgi:hypothetical protein